MSKPIRWIVKSSAFLFLSFLVSSLGMWGQAPAVSAATPELYFWANPSKQLYSLGDKVEITLRLNGQSEQPLLVSRFLGDEFVSFKLIGPDGNEVPWQGEARTSSKGHSASDFTVLGQYKEVDAKRTISLNDGAGFAFDKPGQYSLTAEFSMGSPGRLAPFAAQGKAPTGTFHSEVKFCIEACTLEPFQVRYDAPRSALDAVRAFYTSITRYRQLGIPSGRARKALWPHLSKRLANELDSLQACDNDYYQRYGEILRANTFKPATPWLEDGIFTGPDDAATPSMFRIVSSRSVGENRVDVELGFTTKQTYSPDLGLPPSYDHFEGVVTAILESNRWVIDDYVAMYGNDDLQRLSAGFPECKGGLWVGEKSY
jgi:hypothetical protein